jgi:hypothetical protein
MRRLLLDMHIPDWDPAFLAQYDPRALADTYEAANLSSVMLYCKSHLGLCYWPTKVGTRHAALGDHDWVGELVDELRARQIGVCAYTSVVYDNRAVLDHPEWRQRRSDGLDGQFFSRYGWACLNNPDYVAYEHDLLRELLTDYRFDALFVDMPFWPLMCACEHCLAKFDAEVGGAPPDTVDWTSPGWCAYQAARERWSDELVAGVAALAREVSPGIAVTHNMAPALVNWVIAQPLAAARHDDFVAGDLYGDRVEQLVVSKLSLHLSETRPAEFMTSRCVNLQDHVRLKREAEMAMQAAAATAMSSAFLFIDAIDPAGTVNAGVYERIRRVFATTAPYEPFLGGEPVEDVAVWFSVDSQMDFAENGTPANGVGFPKPRWPHLDALRGACRALQRAHVPFGVITARQLDVLARWRAIVLPDVSRMSDAEVDAFRAYVAAGGRIYASGYTSLVDTAGRVRPDFGLADVFGCSYDSDEQGRMVYLAPTDAGAAAAIAPQDHVSVHLVGEGLEPGAKPLCGMPRLAAGAAGGPGAASAGTASAGTASAGTVLADLVVPFAHPQPGTVQDQAWASIHSSPPWEPTVHPVVVEHRFGSHGGAAVYCAAPIEKVDAEANEALFGHLLGRLLDGPPSFAADAHPAVWVNATDQGDRLVVSCLNYQAELPPVAVPVELTLRPPAGRRFAGVTSAPDGARVASTEDDTGAITVRIDAVETLAVLVAAYSS